MCCSGFHCLSARAEARSASSFECNCCGFAAAVVRMETDAAHSQPGTAADPLRITTVVLEIGAAGCSGKWDNVADILHPCQIHDAPFKTQPKSGMFYAAVTAEIQKPPVILFF